MARTDVPLRPAATVMLLRDHPDEGLQVFMLQRTLSAAFARGMYVFPTPCSSTARDAQAANLR